MLFPASAAPHLRRPAPCRCLLRFALGTAFTCTFTILNNSVPAHARGRMQGVAMTLGSLARAVGPTLGAEVSAWASNPDPDHNLTLAPTPTPSLNPRQVFAWSLTNGLPLPFDVHFVFLLMSALNVIPVAIALRTFSPALDRPLEAREEAEAAEQAARRGGGAASEKAYTDTELQSTRGRAPEEGGLGKV